MKLPLPRVIFLLPLFLFGITAPGFYDAYWNMTNRYVFLSGEDKTGYIIFMAFSPFFFWGGLCLLHACLTREYSLWLWGETFSSNIALPSGGAFTIKPLTGLSDKMLIIRLNCKLPAEFRHKVVSFRFYRELPPTPCIRYQVCLLGDNGQERTRIAEKIVIQRLASVWATSKEEHAKVKQDDDTIQFEGDESIQFPVQKSFEYYILQIQAQIGYEPTADAEFKPVETKSILDVWVKLAVGLKVKDAKRHTECVIRKAAVEIA